MNNKLNLYNLINPSDPYTFRAHTIQIAGVCALLLPGNYGVQNVDDETEKTPIIFGWNKWIENNKIDEAWISAHSKEIAQAFASFIIGSPEERKIVEKELEELPEENHKEYLLTHLEKNRTSMNNIGAQACHLAEECESFLKKL